MHDRAIELKDIFVRVSNRDAAVGLHVDVLWRALQGVKACGGRIARLEGRQARSLSSSC